MITITKKSDCNGCHACASVCPKKCISMVSDEEGFLFPNVDANKCVNCNLCDKVCPLKKASQKPLFNPIAYSGYNKNKQVQLESSSGGIFTLLAEEILSRGGVVFGASFNEKFEVVHTCVDNTEDLAKLRGSKYVQSRIGQCFVDVKAILNGGGNKPVLFTGTPCQIAGLLSYLGKSYDNLYTQDFICHGVPSPLVWEKYKEKQVLKYNSPLSQVFFRDKSKSWLSFGMKLTFECGDTYFQIHQKDEMFDAFLKNKCLRESCYSCAFKSRNRLSDITLADYWGVNIIRRRQFNKNGTSLILVHSQKGKELIDKIKDKMVFVPTSLTVANIFNPSLTKSAHRHSKRDAFMKSIQTMTFDEAFAGKTKNKG